MTVWFGCTDSRQDVSPPNNGDTSVTDVGLSEDGGTSEDGAIRADMRTEDYEGLRDASIRDLSIRDVSIDRGHENDQNVEPPCDPNEVLERNGCANAGCHATPVRANLDLSSSGFEAGLLNTASPTEGCEGRLLIDVERPEQSLMFQVIGVHPPLGGDIDTCQTVMPPLGEPDHVFNRLL